MASVDDNENRKLVQNILDDFEENLKEDYNIQTNRSNQIEEEKCNDLLELQQAWVQEKTVPELLPYKESLIDRIMNRVRKQLEFIEINSVELQTHEKDIKLMLVIIESELERIQFLIRAYVRIRLSKIDRFALYIQNSTTEIKKLNNDEVMYMEGHLAMLHELFYQQYLKKMPNGGGVESDNSNSNIGDDPEMVEIPDLDRHVFVRCVSDSQLVLNDKVSEQREELFMKAGEVYIMRYKSVAQLVQRGAVEVI